MALDALRDIAEARQIARVAEEAGVAREALYRMLGENGNPTYHSLLSILSALGLRIVFVPAGPSGDRRKERNGIQPRREPKAKRRAAPKQH